MISYVELVLLHIASALLNFLLGMKVIRSRHYLMKQQAFMAVNARFSADNLKVHNRFSFR